jgi:AcrR family transcriptional regulator
MCDRQVATRSASGGDPALPVGPPWLRTATPKGPGLTLEAIVEAAIILADGDGLEAVSIRRVAAALNARPMSLYSYIRRKDDLLELMNDWIVTEILVPDPLPADWRDALRAIAHRTRAALLRHPWTLSRLGSRPSIGPNVMRHLEQSLAAVDGLDVTLHEKIAILRAVDTFTLGYTTSELGHREAQRRENVSEPGWRESVSEYLRELLSGGEFPRLRAVGVDDLVHADGPHADESFTTGLEWLLTGIAAGLPAGPEPAA